MIFILSCGEKKQEKPESNQDIEKISYKVGDAYLLKMGYNVGDKFSYSLNTSSENTHSMGEKSQTTKTNILYKISGHVIDKDTTGDIDIKFTFNNIKISADLGTQGSISFDSENPADSAKRKMPAFLEHTALLNNDFFARLTSRGEIIEIYRLDNIIKKLLGPNPEKIDDKVKTQIRANLQNQLKNIIQQIYQLLPDKIVKIDSSWNRSYIEKIAFLDVNNTATYTLKEIVRSSGSDIAKISAKLTSEPVGKRTVEDQGVKYNIEKPVITGGGSIEFNLEKGLVLVRDITYSVNMVMSMTKGAQSSKITTNALNRVKVELLK
jgi:hypothetical protein